MWDEVHVWPRGVVSPGLVSGLLSMVLARRPRLWNAPSGAAPSLLTAPLHGVPALVLCRLRTQRMSGFYLRNI